MNTLPWKLSTPVCMTIFNRPDTTQRVFDAIRAAQPPTLLVIADAPRLEKPGEREKCSEALAILEQVDWQCEVLTNVSDGNLGIRKRIASGLKWLFDTVEDAIILEHDCLPHPTFFRFCQELLDRYRTNDTIAVISGNNHQLGHATTQSSYYFSRYTHLQGWASWRRAFLHYDETMAQWPRLRADRFLETIFERSVEIDYWTSIFEQTYRELIHTWDYQVMLGAWERNELTVMPRVNLVSNIGFREDSPNTSATNAWVAELPCEEMRFPLLHPPTIERDGAADDFDEKTVFSGLASGEWRVLVFSRLLSQIKDFMQRNRNEEALNVIEKALAIQSRMPALHHAKGVVLTRLSRPAEATESLQHVFKLDAHHASARQLSLELESGSDPP